MQLYVEVSPPANVHVDWQLAANKLEGMTHKFDSDYLCDNQTLRRETLLTYNSSGI